MSTLFYISIFDNNICDDFIAKTDIHLKPFKTRSHRSISRDLSPDWTPLLHNFGQFYFKLLLFMTFIYWLKLLNKF